MRKNCYLPMAPEYLPASLTSPSSPFQSDSTPSTLRGLKIKLKLYLEGKSLHKQRSPKNCVE